MLALGVIRPAASGEAQYRSLWKLYQGAAIVPIAVHRVAVGTTAATCAIARGRLAVKRTGLGLGGVGEAASRPPRGNGRSVEVFAKKGRSFTDDAAEHAVELGE